MRGGRYEGQVSPPSPLLTLAARRGQLSPRLLARVSPRHIQASAISAGHRRRCRRLWKAFLVYLGSALPTVHLLMEFILHLCRTYHYKASTVLTYVDSLQAKWWRESILPPLKDHPHWVDFVTGLKRLTKRSKTKSAPPAKPEHLRLATLDTLMSPEALWTLSFCAHAWARLGDLADTLVDDVVATGGFTLVHAFGAKEARRRGPAPRLVVDSGLLPSALPPGRPGSLLLSPTVRRQILSFSNQLGLTGHSWRRGGIQQGAAFLPAETTMAKARHANMEVHLKYLRHVLTKDEQDLGLLTFSGTTSRPTAPSSRSMGRLH